MDGFGNIISFYIKGDKNTTFKFLNKLSMIHISNNLGDAKSLVTHPASTTHQRLSQEDRDAVGVTDGLVRISVGLEDIEDIMEDLDQALRI